MLSRKPASISLALIVCLTFVTAAGVARPVKEPFTSGRHSHSVLAPRHGGPPAWGSTASYRNAPTPCRDYRSQVAPRSDILFVSGLTLARSIVPWFPCT